MVAVFMPVLKSAPGAASPLHQSHADLPALIHEGSAIRDGGLRLSTIFDSIRRPGSSPIISTRHGLVTGVVPSTATPGSSTRGDNSACMPNRSLLFFRYMPG